MADLYLLHPDLEPRVVHHLAGDLWPDGNLQHLPEGFREISSLFFGLRAFLRSEPATVAGPEDAALPGRVRDWVDATARAWAFDDVFKARGIDFWIFFRDPLVTLLHELMAERQLLERIAASERLSVMAVGIDRYRRKLLRGLSEALPERLRAEVAFVDPPQSLPDETATERRLRRMFFVVQDAWHGVKLLFEDIFLRRPKVLIVSDARGLQRRAMREGSRSDVHFETIWRQGRKRPWRMYYRTDSYHPDVGAMTRGRLAPTYLRHALFLLAQTSRGIWEVRSIQRQWARLRESEEFRRSMVFDGMPVAEIMLDWLDEALAWRLPMYVRATRRESHFLRGVRPDVVLMNREQETNRAVMLAANQLRIPTVAVQLRPLNDRDHAYMLSQRPLDKHGWLPDRLCVFSQDAKRFLVEKGGIDPSAIVVSGDPRAGDNGHAGSDDDRTSDVSEPLAADDAINRLRKRWGVEGERKVIAVASPPRHCPELLRLVAGAVAKRDDVFILVRPTNGSESVEETARWLASVEELAWIHLDLEPGFTDWLLGVDLLVTTSREQMAEGLLRRRRVALIELGERPQYGEADPGDLAARIKSAGEMNAFMSEFLASRLGPIPADERWRAFVTGTFGRASSEAAEQVLDTVGQVMGKR